MRPASAGEPAEPTPEAAAQALRRAVGFFRQKLAVRGTYVWKYMADLSQRHGEGPATATQGWVQAPGSSAIGKAFLQAYRVTHDRYYLDAALETAHGLVRTQLQSGGWWYSVELDPAARKRWCYLADLGTSPCPVSDNEYRDASTLDDDNTQGALVFLMLVDAATEQKDAAVHRAVGVGLRKLIEAQYPNGSWPVRLDLKVPNELTAAAWRSRIPERWSWTFVDTCARLRSASRRPASR